MNEEVGARTRWLRLPLAETELARARVLFAAPDVYFPLLACCVTWVTLGVYRGLAMFFVGNNPWEFPPGPPWSIVRWCSNNSKREISFGSSPPLSTEVS